MSSGLILPSWAAIVYDAFSWGELFRTRRRSNFRKLDVDNIRIVDLRKGHQRVHVLLMIKACNAFWVEADENSNAFKSLMQKRKPIVIGMLVS